MKRKRKNTRGLLLSLSLLLLPYQHRLSQPRTLLHTSRALRTPTPLLLLLWRPTPTNHICSWPYRSVHTHHWPSICLRSRLCLSLLRLLNSLKKLLTRLSLQDRGRSSTLPIRTLVLPCHVLAELLMVVSKMLSGCFRDLILREMWMLVLYERCHLRRCQYLSPACRFHSCQLHGDVGGPVGVELTWSSLLRLLIEWLVLHSGRASLTIRRGGHLLASKRGLLSLLGLLKQHGFDSGILDDLETSLHLCYGSGLTLGVSLLNLQLRSFGLHQPELHLLSCHRACLDLALGSMPLKVNRETVHAYYWYTIWYSMRYIR